MVPCCRGLFWFDRHVAYFHSVERLRIGYIGSDFTTHPTGLLLQQMFQFHDRRRFEVHIFMLSPPDNSSVRQTIATQVEHWHDVSEWYLDKTTTGMVQLGHFIYANKIQILIETNGLLVRTPHTLLSWQTAPIQVSFLAYPGTTGSSFIQYLISDQMVTPLEPATSYAHVGFTEQLLLLPHHYQVNSYHHAYSFSSTLSQIRLTREHYGLPARPAVVFCNFNTLYKIDPMMFTLWIDILRRVPDSVLWLTSHNNEVAMANIKRMTGEHNIDASRVIFSAYANKTEHLQRATLADLFLDTMVVNAHSTAADVVWAGLPLVTIAGDTMQSRLAAGLLVSAGLSELITTSTHQYLQLVVDLATHPTRLASIRHRLIQRNSYGQMEELPLSDSSDGPPQHATTAFSSSVSSTSDLSDVPVLTSELSPLFDLPRWVTNLETGFELMWHHYVDGLTPTYIVVPDVQGHSTTNQYVLGGGGVGVGVGGGDVPQQLRLQRTPPSDSQASPQHQQHQQHQQQQYGRSGTTSSTTEQKLKKEQKKQKTRRKQNPLSNDVPHQPESLEVEVDATGEQRTATPAHRP